MSALPNETKLPEWKQVLAARGILEAALDCGWAYREERGVGGWAYPLHRYNGQRFLDILRWKAIDRTTAPNPYLWIGKKPADCQYYWAKGIDAALEDSWGTLYITAGEPDMLSLIAAGRRNVTTFFGEQSIPESFLRDLQTIKKVSRIVYLADMDSTGIDCAVKLTNALQGFIECEVKRLPCKDVNDLWIAHEFNTPTFLEAIDSAPAWTFRQDTPVTEPMKGYYNYKAYAEAVEKALKLPDEKRNGWSKPVACIFSTHANDDKNPSGGWHFSTHTFRCFKCGETWGCDAVAGRLGINLEDFNENAGKNKAPANLTMFNGGQGKQQQPALPLEEIIRTSDESLTRYVERLEGKHIGEITAAPFPFTVLHDLGGFCEILKPRKMVGVIGLSGGGKTSFLESLIDVLRQAGEFHTLWWGKEWRWDEMSDRAVQRQGGMTITQVAKFEMWQSETQNGGKARYGVRPSDDLIERSKQLARDMQKWAGKVFYIDKPMPLDATLEHAQVFLDKKKAEGLPVRVAVWDYASLFDVKGARSEMDKISNGLAMVKEFGETNDLFSFVASQPRKDDAEQVKAGDKVLSAEDAMYMNDHKYNLLLTLNPMYIDGIMQNWGIINVVKNSGGKTGKVSVQMDLAHLRWLDKPVNDGWGE